MAGDSGGGGEVLGPVSGGPEVSKVGAPESVEAIPSRLSQTAANALEKELNEPYVDPEALMKGFVEGYYEEYDGNKGPLESRRGEEESHPKAEHQKDGGSNEDENGKRKPEEGKSERPATLEEIITAYQKGEIDLPTLLDRYQKSTDLQAINLEEDPRYKKIFEARKIVYKEDELPSRIAEEFQRSNPGDFESYRKFGISLSKDGQPSIDSDPVWREMKVKARTRGSEIAAWNGNLSAIDREVNIALYNFCRQYPEKARIYALFEGENSFRINEALKRINETVKETERGRGGPGLQDSSGAEREDKQEGGNEEEGKKTGDEQKSGEEEPKTQEQMIKELQKEVEALRREIGELRSEVGELRALFSQLNSQAEQSLREQGRLPSNYEKTKQENPYAALALILAILLGLSVSKISNEQ